MMDLSKHLIHKFQKIHIAYCDNCNSIIDTSGGPSKNIRLICKEVYREVRVCSIKCKEEFNVDKFNYVLPSVLVGIVTGEERRVSSSDAIDFAQRYNTFYYEVNLETGRGVEDAVCGLASLVANFLAELKARRSVIQKQKSCVIN